MSRLGKRQLHELYYYMMLTRRLEKEVARLHRERRIEGPLFFGIGQESVSVGTAYRLDSTDFVASSLPSLGHLLARGIQPFEIVTHLFGKGTGSTRGRDGYFYWGDLARGIVPPAGHLAAHIGVIAGMALASKLTGKSAVAVALADDRAVDTGDFHEGLNFAAVHRLPAVVVLDHEPGVSENDRYLYEMTRGYGVPSLPVDGVDILQVLQVVETAVERARGGKGPTLIEVRTARGPSHGFYGESVPFPWGGSRRRDDTAVVSGETRPQDPVEHFESFLVDHGLLQPVERALVLDRIEHLVMDGIQRADEEPFPDTGSLEDGIYHAGSLGSGGMD